MKTPLPVAACGAVRGRPLRDLANPAEACSATSACSRVMPSNPSGQAGLGQPPPGLVLDLDVVVVFGPVVPDEQHHPQQLLRS